MDNSTASAKSTRSRLVDCQHAVFTLAGRIGGAIVARGVPGYDLPPETAILLDIRVHPSHRGHGFGAALLDSALAWAGGELVIETQDVNVAACRFYKKMGGRPWRVEPDGYGPEIDEAKIIWRFGA